MKNRIEMMRHLPRVLMVMIVLGSSANSGIAQVPAANDHSQDDGHSRSSSLRHNPWPCTYLPNDSDLTFKIPVGANQDALRDSKVVPAGFACDAAEACDSTPGCCSETCGSCFENLSFFLGLDGSKQPQDFGVNANFGGRAHVNWGAPLWEAMGLGIQLGTSINYTDNAVQVFERVDGTSERFQNFTTVGLFQRTDSGFSWAAGYDFLYQNFYDNFSLGQWRGDVGYALNDANEIGTWFAISSKKDDGFYATIPVTLDPITQGNIYLRRTWENDTETTFWLGIAEGHGEANLALGDLAPVGERLVFGADIFVPLSPRLALFGQANFITPADTGTVDAYLGIAYYPGGSHGARKRRFAPRLPVANNTTFANDLSR